MNNQNCASTCPPSLKALQPYLIRAHDFAAKSPLIAYFCKAYAIQLGIPLLQNITDQEESGEASKFLMQLMDLLEEEKKQLSVPSDEEASEMLLRTALLLFKRADDKERASDVSDAVVKMFSTSAVLMEVMKQFGELDPEVVDKIKYARYTASQVKKALDSKKQYVSPNEPVKPKEPEAMHTDSPTPPPVHHDPAPPPPPLPPPPPMDNFDSLLQSFPAPPTGTHSPNSQMATDNSQQEMSTAEAERELARLMADVDGSSPAAGGSAPRAPDSTENFFAPNSNSTHSNSQMGSVPQHPPAASPSSDECI
eukprot:Sspe_Gene.14906::Locus_5172_Transcript_1_1_Confidence_1.000_Length_1006::g.14906::m.14906/K12199/VTA1, LIP5; vacuolar protein sorting-associated protein VTA1